MDTSSIFTTQQVADLFGVSIASIKVWTGDFHHYLSPTATPAPGRKRAFTTDDLRVFALVREYRRHGYTPPEIHAALTAGERGEIPEQNALVRDNPPAALLLSLKERITTLEADLLAARALAEQRAGQVGLLREQLTERETTIRQLYRELASLEAKRPPTK